MASRRSKSIPEDQTVFRHGYNLRLERFACSLFGKRYHKSVDRLDIGFWKEVYVKTLEVLATSVFRSVGAVDKSHKAAIEDELKSGLEWIRKISAKDEIHGALIVTLFNLVFLLLGRLPYPERGSRRSLSTFRTLTYSQTEEQLSWLLQSFIQRNAKEHGFEDAFDADYAFLKWARENKLKRSDRTAYVEWVKQNYPQTYAKFA